MIFCSLVSHDGIFNPPRRVAAQTLPAPRLAVCRAVGQEHQLPFIGTLIIIVAVGNRREIYD
jgi:hypothetical protein